MNCPNCNAPLEENAKFCENCGAPITAPEAAPMVEMLAPAIQVQKKASTVKWIVIAVVGVLIIAGISVGLYFKMQADKKVKQYSEQISLGEKYLEELKYDDAIIAFTKAIVIEPKKEKPYFALVDVYIDIKDTEKADEIIEKIETLFPKNTEVVEKKEKVNVVIEEIKVEKKKKELKWLVEPTIDVEEIIPVNTRSALRRKDAFQEDKLYKNVEYTTNYSDNGEWQSYKAHRTCGMVDYTGKILVPSDKGIVAESGSLLTKPEDDGLSTFGKKCYHYNEDGSIGNETLYRFHTDVAPYYEMGNNKYNGIDWKPSFAGTVESDHGLRSNLSVEELQALPKCVLLNEQAQRVGTDFYEDGFAMTEDLVALCKDGKWGFLDITGKEIIPFEYEKAYFFQDGIAPACKDGKWGFIKPDGTVYKDFQLEGALPPHNGMAFAKYNGKWGVLDVTEDGNAVLPEATVTPAPEPAPAPEIVPATENELNDTVAPRVSGKEHIATYYADFNGDGVNDLFASYKDGSSAYFWIVDGKTREVREVTEINNRCTIGDGWFVALYMQGNIPHVFVSEVGGAKATVHECMCFELQNGKFSEVYNSKGRIHIDSGSVGTGELLAGYFDHDDNQDGEGLMLSAAQTTYKVYTLVWDPSAHNYSEVLKETHRWNREREDWDIIPG